jgi:hypothetical protein
MSESRASSGVRNLRAMFESGGKADDNSPPSRGRSPNGSEQSTPARPLSKVRTNFVAVERPGQPAPFGLRKQSDFSIEESGNEMDTSQDAKPTTNGKLGSTATDNVGNGLPPVNGSKPTNNGEGVQSEMNGTMKGKDEALPDKRIPEAQKAEPNASARVVEGVEEENWDNDFVLNENDQEGLGAILKGSAFQSSPATKPEKIDTSVKTPKTPTTSSKAKSTSTPAKVTNKVKETISPKKINTPSKINGKAKDTSPPKKDLPSPKKHALRPSNISTGKDSPSPTTTSKSSATLKSPALTRTPKTPTAPSPRHSTKTAVQEGPAATKEVSKKPSRVSNVSTTSTTAGPRPRQAVKPQKDELPKKSPTSPNSVSKTKSPTRPINLPAHLTAPTASSVAKTHGLPPPNAANTLARRPSTLKRDQPTAPGSRPTAPIASTIRNKTSRASLPSQSTTHQERPRSSISSIVTRAPNEGFLARMMRPTASSASKVHDKIEPKSPPRRSGTVKGKAKSEGKADDKDKRASLKASQAPGTQGVDAEDEPVSPSATKSEARAASVLNEEKENQNLAAEDETVETSIPEAEGIQT